MAAILFRSQCVNNNWTGQLLRLLSAAINISCVLGRRQGGHVVCCCHIEAQVTLPTFQRRYFSNETFWNVSVFIEISMLFIPRGLVYSSSSLVFVPRRYLNQLWPSSPTHICVTRHHWVIPRNVVFVWEHKDGECMFFRHCPKIPQIAVN